MTGKIICISFVPLTQKVYEDFYFQEFIDRNINVAFWDVSEIVFGAPAIQTQTFKQIEQVLISDKKVFEEKIKLYSGNIETLFLLNLNYSYKTIFFYKQFKKYKVKTFFLGRGMLPSPIPYHSKSGLSSYIGKLLQKTKAGLRIIKNLYAFNIKKFNLAAKIDYLFVAGEYGHLTIGIGADLDFNHADIIRINSFDYDRFLSIKNQESKSIEDKYILFLDEYLPRHPDFDLLKMDKIPEDEYYSSLNGFFDRIEKTYGFNVIIAAHPKSDYSEANPFNSRKIIRNKTAELVKNSELVLTHMSTSISFAVLFNKPILLLSSSMLEKFNAGHISNYIRSFSKALALTVVDFDKPDLNLNLNTKNINYYNKFKYDYCTTKESEDQFTSEKVVDFISSKLNKHNNE